MIKNKLDQETWLCQTYLDDFLVKIWTILDHIYKNQVEYGYKDHPIEFMVDHLGPFGNIKDHLIEY